MTNRLISICSRSILATMLIAVMTPSLPLLAQSFSLEGGVAVQSSGSMEYAVASVKPHNQGGGSEGSMGSSYSPEGFKCSNLTLENLIVIAYGIDQHMISGGPEWIDATGFDIETKVSEDEVERFKKLNKQERNDLLKAVLADRFKLKVHFVTKNQQMYELLIGKGGSKLREATPAASGSHETVMYNPGLYKGSRVSMKMLSDILSFTLHSNVVDRTNLNGTYDVELKWKPGIESQQSSEDDGVALPSIFTALGEQLGLKLASTKGPVQNLVIDHAGMPSAN